MAPPQWAYQLENYVAEPDEEFVCSICRAVFCEPTLCPCDHVFCAACITQWLKDNRNCPICRKRASMTSIKHSLPIIKNLIMKLQLNCHNKGLGCTAQFSVEKSEAHVKECDYELVQCKNKPCTDKMFRKDITEHETKSCPHRPNRCIKCKGRLPISAVTNEHDDCIRALRKLLKERTALLRRKVERIKQLKAEIKTLKKKVKDNRSEMSSFSRDPLNSDSLSSISADEIRIDIGEYDSVSVSSISSDSDLSSGSFYIFANDPLPDDNGESDSFLTYMDNEDNIDNETSNVSEYRNAESQTVDILNYNQDEHPRNSNSTENPQSRKRRPTTHKPAKRRVPTYSSDDDDEIDNFRLSQDNWHGMAAGKSDHAEVDPRDTSNSHMEAGPSSASALVRSNRSGDSKSANSQMEAGSSSVSATVRSQHQQSDNSKSKNRPLSKKRAKQAGNHVRDNAVSSRIPVTSDTRVFERTLTLLEQYNLESDPEWLPEYASHRGNTTTESDSSYISESSNSELSDVDSLENNSVSNDGSQPEFPAMSDFMNWMFDSTSEEDPDWRPTNYDD